MAQGRRRVNEHLEILEDNTDKVVAAIKRIANASVMVGIPSDREQPHYNDTGNPAPVKRKEGDINNATLGYIHETGAPAANIPARPWLSPGVRESSRQWRTYMMQAGKAAFEGKPDIMDKALHAAGVTAVSAVKNRITSGLQPELAQATIDARRRRTPSRQARVADDTTPLVDTAQMLNSISYVVRNRGRG